MNLYDHIATAKSLEGDTRCAIQESQTAPNNPQQALDVLRHLQESRPPEDKPTQLSSLPIPN